MWAEMQTAALLTGCGMLLHCPLSPFEKSFGTKDHFLCDHTLTFEGINNKLCLANNLLGDPAPHA